MKQRFSFRSFISESSSSSSAASRQPVRQWRGVAFVRHVRLVASLRGPCHRLAGETPDSSLGSLSFLPSFLPFAHYFAVPAAAVVLENRFDRIERSNRAAGVCQFDVIVPFHRDVMPTLFPARGQLLRRVCLFESFKFVQSRYS